MRISKERKQKRWDQNFLRYSRIRHLLIWKQQMRGYEVEHTSKSVMGLEEQNWIWGSDIEKRSYACPRILVRNHKGCGTKNKINWKLIKNKNQLEIHQPTQRLNHLPEWSHLPELRSFTVLTEITALVQSTKGCVIAVPEEKGIQNKWSETSWEFLKMLKSVTVHIQKKCYEHQS